VDGRVDLDTAVYKCYVFTFTLLGRGKLNVLKTRWVSVRPIAAYRRTQMLSLQLGLRVGGHLMLTDFRPEKPKWTLAYGWRRRWLHNKYRRGYYYDYYYRGAVHHRKCGRTAYNTIRRLSPRPRDWRTTNRHTQPWLPF